MGFNQVESTFEFWLSALFVGGGRFPRNTAICRGQLGIFWMKWNAFSRTEVKASPFLLYVWKMFWRCLAAFPFHGFRFRSFMIWRFALESTAGECGVNFPAGFHFVGSNVCNDFANLCIIKVNNEIFWGEVYLQLYATYFYNFVVLIYNTELMDRFLSR